MSKLAPATSVAVALLLVFFSAFLARSTFSKDVLVSWDPPPGEEGIIGYSVYVTDENQAYPPISVSRTTSCIVSNLNENSRYLISVTASNWLGLVSDSSTVLQYPATAPCLVTASPRTSLLAQQRSADSFLVTAPSDCSWIPVSEVPWISIGDVQWAGGRRRVSYFTTSNRSTEPRQGTINIGEQTFTVTQSGGGPLPPFILRDLPNSSTVNEGEFLQLSVEIEQDNYTHYQWLKDGNPIAGATNAILIPTQMRLEDAGNYLVDIWNEAGTVRAGPLDLMIYPKPRILEGGQLQSQVVELGESAILSVNASGPRLQYSWTKDGVGFVHDASVLICSPVEEKDLGKYQVVIYNDAGSIASDEAVLTTRQLEQQLGRIHLTLRPDRSLLVQGEGIPGETYDIEVSQDLITWRISDSVVVDEGGRFTVDAPAPGASTLARWFVRTARRPRQDPSSPPIP